MPTKIIQPCNSVFVISSHLLKIIYESPKDLDSLIEHFNKNYYKKIETERILLALDFLFMLNKIRIEDEIIRINM